MAYVFDESVMDCIVAWSAGALSEEQAVTLTGIDRTSLRTAKQDAIKNAKAMWIEHKNSRCNATIEIENGEAVTPCHKTNGHDGEHEGYCLGSRAVWTDDEIREP